MKDGVGEILHHRTRNIGAKHDFRQFYPLELEIKTDPTSAKANAFGSVDVGKIRQEIRRAVGETGGGIQKISRLH